MTIYVPPDKTGAWVSKLTAKEFKRLYEWIANGNPIAATHRSFIGPKGVP